MFFRKENGAIMLVKEGPTFCFFTFLKKKKKIEKRGEGSPIFFTWPFLTSNAERMSCAFVNASLGSQVA